MKSFYTSHLKKLLKISREKQRKLHKADAHNEERNVRNFSVREAGKIIANEGKAVSQFKSKFSITGGKAEEKIRKVAYKESARHVLFTFRQGVYL